MKDDGQRDTPGERNRLGERLRAIRKEMGLTLAEVAERSGVSIATLSKAERGLSAIGYDRFSQLAAGLGVDLAELFAEGRRFEPGLVATAGDGDFVRHVAENYRLEMMFTEVSGKNMTPVLATIPAGRKMDLTRYVSHPGQEFVHVISGAIRLIFQQSGPVDLEAGESAYFDSAQGHLYTPLGTEDARIVVVCSADAEDLSSAFAASSEGKG